MRDYIEICKIINTHGVAGMVKADAWCDSPKVLADMKELYKLNKNGEYEKLTVIRGSVQGRFTLLKFEGVTTFEDAVKLKNTVLFAKHDDVPVEEGAVLIDDLKGLQVIDADSGKVYGTLNDVINLGASDLYEVNTPNGMVLMPAVEEFVDVIDLDEGIFIRPIPGMFDEI